MEKFANIFKAYDVRGIYPVEINAPVARRVAEAFARILKPQKVVVGQDVRAHGEELKKAVIDGLLAAGVDVVDIGIITTDQLYFAVGNYGFDGGLSVTASHNPAEYNGLKFSEKSGAPIQSDNLTAMRDWALSSDELQATTPGKLSRQNVIDDYVDHVLGYIDTKSIKPLRIVANANFGAVGRGVDKIADKLHLELERLNWQEDGNFPKGPPNPLLPENRDETIALIKKTKPDFGVAWDADADRVFFFTGEGDFIPSTFIVALLSRQFLKRYPGSKIVHDITTSWVIDDSVKAAGGIPVTNRTGHTFMKARMRTEDAPFAGESSGHYYFRDSFYADNGIVPFLMLLEMVSKTGQSLKELVEPLTDSYKVSGEINFTVTDPVKAIEKVEKELAKQGRVDKMDGLAVTTDKWRFSVRPSNTEPLFRLNAEAHDQETLDGLVRTISSIIDT
jgi:phosphomannomutase